MPKSSVRPRDTSAKGRWDVGEAGAELCNGWNIWNIPGNKAPQVAYIPWNIPEYGVVKHLLYSKRNARISCKGQLTPQLGVVQGQCVHGRA